MVQKQKLWARQSLRFKVKSAPNYRVQTKVIIAKNLNKQLILSKLALKKLSIVPPNFPEVYDFSEHGEANSISASVYRGSDYDECGCLKRAETPQAPAAPPCELTMGNRKKIEQFILEYYAASVFNKCEHQKLPALSGPPMQILINKEMVKPAPVNTPAIVALSWQKRVKDDIDRDVRLGVIEPVPENTPQTYCARMHVVPKHNREPRRVVDFTDLNRISIRQTHPSVKLFDLACMIPGNCIMSQFDSLLS